MGKTDFLDPIHHKAATGRNSYNLDGWMLSRYHIDKALLFHFQCLEFVQMSEVEYCHDQDILSLHCAVGNF